VAAAPHVTLLHLSDIQLGPHHRFEAPSAPGGLLHRLREDMDRMRAEEGLRPDLVLLTGDLTEYGLKSQFNDLLSFAHGLVEVTELPPRRIVVSFRQSCVTDALSSATLARAGGERWGTTRIEGCGGWPSLRHSSPSCLATRLGCLVRSPRYGRYATRRLMQASRHPPEVRTTSPAGERLLFVAAHADRC